MPEREPQPRPGTNDETRRDTLEGFVLDPTTFRVRGCRRITIGGPQPPPGIGPPVVQKDGPEEPKPLGNVRVLAGKPSLDLLAKMRMKMAAVSQHPGKQLRHVQVASQPNREAGPRHIQVVGILRPKAVIYQAHYCRTLIGSARFDVTGIAP